jgi:hypothetical protein
MITMIHYIKIIKYHEENRTSTEERAKYWREYQKAIVLAQT